MEGTQEHQEVSVEQEKQLSKRKQRREEEKEERQKKKEKKRANKGYDVNATKGNKVQKGSVRMRTASDVIKRLQWDEMLPSEFFTIGYIDRWVLNMHCVIQGS